MTGFELNSKFNFHVGVDVNSGENIHLREDGENNGKSKDSFSRHNDILFVEKEENDKPDSYGFSAAKHRFRGIVDRPITNGILPPKNTIGIEDPDDNFKCRGDWLAYNGVSRVVRRHSINGLPKQERSSSRSLSSKCTTPRKSKSSEDEAQGCISSFHRSLRLLGLEPQDLGMTNKDHSSFHYSKPVGIEPTFRTRLVKRSFSLENLRSAIQENHNATQDLLDRKTLCSAVYEEWYFRKQKEAHHQKMAEKLKEQNKQEHSEKFKREQKLKADENFIKWKEQKSKEKEQKKIKNEQAGRTASGMPMRKPNQEEVFLVWKKQKDKLLKQNRSSESEKGNKNKNNDAERKGSAQIAYAFWKKHADEAYREKLQESKRKEEEVENEKKRKQLEKQQIAESAFCGWQHRKNLELKKKSEESKLEEEQTKDEKSMQEAERLYDAEQAFEDWLQKIEDRRNRKIEILHRKRQMVEGMTTAGAGGEDPKTPVLTVACRMLRSPSHESVTTDLSLFSVSSIASEAAAGAAAGPRAMRLVTFKSYSDAQLSANRGPSPNPDSRGGATGQPSSRPPDIPEILWFEEENELIRSCAALSSALGLQKSFSTSDISQLPSPEETPHQPPPRCAVSELALSSVQLEHPRLDHASRSCSTWVAVGDVASTSQLPSPHGGHTTSTTTASAPPPPAFTAADLIRSVNKKVRQNYIRRRLLTTYKALERLSQSEFNLDRLEVTAAAAAATVNSTAASVAPAPGPTTHLTVPCTGAPATSAAVLRVVKQRANKNLPLTIRDVERERGKPLSKYERNMMIFNWLHTLDDSSFEGLQ